MRVIEASNINESDRLKARRIKNISWFSTIIVATTLIFQAHYHPLLTCIGFSLLAFAVCVRLIPAASSNFISAGFIGYDQSKCGLPLL